MGCAHTAARVQLCRSCRSGSPCSWLHEACADAPGEQQEAQGGQVCAKAGVEKRLCLSASQSRRPRAACHVQLGGGAGRAAQGTTQSAGRQGAPGTRHPEPACTPARPCGECGGSGLRANRLCRVRGPPVVALGQHGCLDAVGHGSEGGRDGQDVIPRVPAQHAAWRVLQETWRAAS